MRRRFLSRRGNAPQTDQRSLLLLQSAKLRYLLFCRIDHPRFKSCPLGNCELCLRFSSFSQAKQSFDQGCTNPIFLVALFVLAFDPYPFSEQLRAYSDDALAHAPSLNPVGDGILAPKFRRAAVEQEGKVDAVIVIVFKIETLLICPDRCRERLGMILYRQFFHFIEALVNCTP